MKTKAIIKSTLIFSLLTGILFFFQEYTKHSYFSWLDELYELTFLEITKGFFSHIAVTLPIAIAYTCPFLFYKKIEFKGFLFFTLAITLFLISFLLTLANRNFFQLFYEIRFPILGYYTSFLLLAVLFPAGIFFITRFFNKKKWLLFILLFLCGPATIFLRVDVLNRFRLLDNFAVDSFFLFFFIMVTLSLSSILYCKKFDNSKPSYQDDEILDSPINY